MTSCLRRGYSLYPPEVCVTIYHWVFGIWLTVLAGSVAANFVLGRKSKRKV